MDNCTLDCIEMMGNFSRQATCEFVQSNCQQDTVQFIQGYYCLINQSFILLCILVSLCDGIIFRVGRSELNLSVSLHSRVHNQNSYLLFYVCMSKALAGTTLLALANGAPDVLTAIVAGSSSSDSTALIPFGSLYGASLFDMAFLFGMVIYNSPNRLLTVKQNQSVIPLCFYLLGTLYLIGISIIYGKINIVLSSIFLSFYVIYICIVIYNEKQKNKTQSPLLKTTDAIIYSSTQAESVSSDPSTKIQNLTQLKHDSLLQIQQSKLSKSNRSIMTQDYTNTQVQIDTSDTQQNNRKQSANVLIKLTHCIQTVLELLMTYTIPPGVQGAWNPRRAIISFFLAPLVLTYAYGFTAAFSTSILSIPVAVWIFIPSVPFLAHSIFCIYKKILPQKIIAYTIYSFIIIVAWMANICSILINLVELFQLLTHINSVFLGLTILAWANCIADYISCLVLAKKGYAQTAVSFIFSGQLFNFLIGFGISNVLKTIDGQHDFNLFGFQGGAFQKLSSSIVLVVISFSFVYMIGLIITIIRTKGVFQDTHRKFTVNYYYAFVLVTLGLSVLTDFFRVQNCDM